MRTLFSGVVAGLILALIPAHAYADRNNSEHRALAREVVDLLEVEQPVIQVMQDMAPLIAGSIRAEAPGVTDEFLNDFISRFVDAFAAQMPEFLDEAAAAYADRFTMSELQEIRTFLQTPVGRRLVNEQMGLSNELAVFGESMGARAAERALRDMGIDTTGMGD